MKLKLLLLLTLLSIWEKFVKEQLQYQQQPTLNLIFLVKLKKKLVADHSMFNLHYETCARNKTAMMPLFSVLHII